jgi:hypothetical protein
MGALPCKARLTQASYGRSGARLERPTCRTKMQMSPAFSATLRGLVAAVATVVLSPPLALLGAWVTVGLVGDGGVPLLAFFLLPMLVCGWAAAIVGFRLFVPVVVVLARLSSLCVMAYLVARALQHGSF